MQIYNSHPRSIGKNLVIPNTDWIKSQQNQRMFVAISPKTSLYNTLADELGMYLIKVKENALIFRSENSIACGEHGNNFIDLNLYYNSKRDMVNADLGLYRLICTNGLESFEKLSGIKFENVMSNKINPLTLVNGLENSFDKIENKVKRIQSVEIDQYIKEYLVNDFLEKLNSDSTISYLKRKDHMKFGDIQTMIKLISETNLLNPKRVEDYGNNLWTTYNTIQENTIDIVRNFKNTTKIENKLLLDSIKPIYA